MDILSFGNDTNSPTINDWINIELKHGKHCNIYNNSYNNQWGRIIIRAIDLDDCIMLYEGLTLNQTVFSNNNNNNNNNINTDKKELKSKTVNITSEQLVKDRIDTQVNCLGYNEYLWTNVIHKYLGDTALHLAIRQRKLMCVHMLILLDANTTIRNNCDETADVMCQTILQNSIKAMGYNAVRYILSNTHPTKISKLPHVKNMHYKNIDEVAWKLMRNGRVLYTELPKTYSKSDPILNDYYSNIRKKHLSFNKVSTESSTTIDSNTNNNNNNNSNEKGILSNNTKVGKANEMLSKETNNTTTSNNNTTSANTIKQHNWILLYDESGNPYYYNEITGASSWDKPKEVLEMEAIIATTNLKTTNNNSTTTTNNNSTTTTTNNDSTNKIDIATTNNITGNSENRNNDSDTHSVNSNSENEKSIKKLSRKEKAIAAKTKANTSTTNTNSSIKQDSPSKSTNNGNKTSKNVKIKPTEDVIPTPSVTTITPPVVISLDKVATIRDLYQNIPTSDLMSIRIEIESMKHEIVEYTKQLKEYKIKANKSYFISSNNKDNSDSAKVVLIENELDRLDNELIIKEKNYKILLQQYNDNTRNGISNTSAGKYIDDVWGRNQLIDIVNLIIRQKKLRYKILAKINQPQAKGLALLDSLRINSNIDRILRQEEDLLYGSKKDLYISNDMFIKSEGIKKLKFLNLAKLTLQYNQNNIYDKQTSTNVKNNDQSNNNNNNNNLLNELSINTNNPNNSNNNGQDYESTISSKIVGDSLNDKILFPNKSSKSIQQSHPYTLLNPINVKDQRVIAAMREYYVPNHNNDLELKDNIELKAFENIKEITSISTYNNLKYYNIGDYGLKLLSNALDGDLVINEICLANARITSISINIFANIISNIKVLKYLDLSCNAICNKGANSLAINLSKCYHLTTCNLSGNRIQIQGIIQLLQSIFHNNTSLIWFNLHNNRIDMDDYQIIFKIMEENNYTYEKEINIHATIKNNKNKLNNKIINIINKDINVYEKNKRTLLCFSYQLLQTDDDNSVLNSNILPFKKLIL